MKYNNKFSLTASFALSAAAITLFVSFAKAEDAPICPKCPQGCIPAGYVQDLKSAEELKSAPPECPSDCVPLSLVKNLSASPLCREESPSETALNNNKPKLDSSSAKNSEKQNADEKEGGDNVFSTRHRIMFSPTAATLAPGEMTITGYVGAAWEFQIGVTENIQLGVIGIVPVGVFGLLPTARAGVAFSDEWKGSLGIMAGGFFPLAFIETSVYLYGGNASITYLKKPFQFNVGLIANGFGARTDGEFRNSDVALLLPNAGASFQFSKNWSFLLEAYAPLFAGTDVDDDYMNGKFFMLFYGFRGHGDLMYGDLGFFIPAFKEYFKYVWKYTPIGIPYFSIGFKI